ncbi:MAG: glycosyltransferase family 2 protein [Gemmatimonadetes bacterium]|nr:glycosyltransferase family 2 protein [Gemmatimonadota bacterium]
MSAHPTGPISVVIPVYGSRDILPELVAQLALVLDTVAPYEVIFVCDDSPDGAWEVLKELRDQYPWIRTVNLSRNAGQHNALLCGIRLATHPVIITMDDDLQHPPEEIPKLLEALTPDVDVVYGTPEREHHSLARRVASRLIKRVLEGAMGAETARKTSAFRAFRTHLRDGMGTFGGPFANIDVMLTWGSARFTSISVRHAPRHAGQSGYSVRKLVRHALNMATGFSTLPLRLASLGGFLFMGVGFAMLAYVLGRYFLEGVAVPGFAFLASSISLFSGVQLFALGIIGEYLARMHFRMMDRPTYVVRPEESSAMGQAPPAWPEPAAAQSRASAAGAEQEARGGREEPTGQDSLPARTP